MQQLEAHEMPLWKIFSVEYHSKIPHYQRPYAWETSQAADLLSDLSDALDRNSAEPCFLGSLVLIKQREVPESEADHARNHTRPAAQQPNRDLSE
jgi:hypothetical protein